jgi:DNA-binding XRE family transcriptional regulator
MDENTITAANAAGLAVSLPAARAAVNAGHIDLVVLAWRAGHGASLRYLRDAEGLSLEEVGRLANVSKQAVAGWERGTCLPSDRASEVLAARYGVEPARLRMLGVSVEAGAPAPAEMARV